MNIKRKLEIIQSELDSISDQVFLLKTETPENAVLRFKEKILLPLKSLTAYAENLEEEMAVKS